MAVNRTRTGKVDTVGVLEAARREMTRRQGVAELDYIARTSPVTRVEGMAGMRRVGPSAADLIYDPGPAYIVEISERARQLFARLQRENPLFRLLFFRKR
ncbi:MAG: hypothetical protein N3A57_02685 [Negativicutes bacterium]|nr:hypothetical protein [Negativicutes bacterium]